MHITDYRSLSSVHCTSFLIEVCNCVCVIRYRSLTHRPVSEYLQTRNISYLELGSILSRRQMHRWPPHSKERI